ncbi:MAG: tRNA pseudouridine(55) synthase TruB [Alphaproteobacteria bacterium]|nr:tRNA pseudouridine(55) synthase TruB [Alphaproteobacteria bacterium]
MSRKRSGRPINGWLVLDKPAGLSSARALARVLALTGAAKGGHGGTLDPLATGVLPIALGEATKTVGYVLGGVKRYCFTVLFGEARDTDDAAGTVTAISAVRPDPAAVAAALAGFVGTLEQRPPVFAAIKLHGERAYRIARGGGDPALRPRPVRLDQAELLAMPAPDRAEIAIACGKGFYVRALARDLAQVLGTVGHVADLRRLSSGPFTLDQAISLERLEALGHSPALAEHLMPVATALDDIPALPLSDAAARRLAQGQVVQVQGITDGPARAVHAGRLVALARVEGGQARPVRVFNLEG